jgi:nucleotide-binding universal stress UspA family protein
MAGYVAIAASAIFISFLSQHGSRLERNSRGVIVANESTPMKSLDLKSILVATDFTEASYKALQHGIAIARHYGATLYIVYVVSSMGLTLTGPEAVELAASASERDINRFVNEMVNSGGLNGVEVRPIVLAGNVNVQMESFARAHRVDLIVVSTHGRSGMSRLLFGSMAQMIAKCCFCPVLTVGPHSTGPWLDNPADSGKPLLFATAFHKASAKAAPYAIALANDFQRPLFVLHVVPPHRTHLIEKNCIAHNDYEALALAHLNELIPSDAQHKCAASFLVESCDPADGILRAARRIHATTIIMGAHRDSISDLSTRLPGSITNHVNRRAMCPVLTVRG